MAEIGMLWIGNPLTKIELISLHSFLYYNHNVTVYLYDQSIELPVGVKKADANLILDSSKIFKLHNTYATFSDLFRYYMIKKTGKVWADLDTVCLSDDWNFGSKTYASFIGHDVSNSVLSIDKDHEVLDYLVEKASEIYNYINEETLNYRIIGSILLTNAFKEFKLMDNVLPEDVLIGLSYSNSEKLFIPGNINNIISKNSKAVSIFNSNFRGREHEKNILPNGSSLEYFYNKFVIGEEND